MLNEEQKKAFDEILKHKNVFLTGKAGSGKSFLIRYLKDYYDSHDLECALVAMTGVASSLVDGYTLHKWAGIGISKTFDGLVKLVKKNKRALKRWTQTDVLIVDEVSMLGVTLFEMLDKLGRALRGNDRFWGGIKVIFCGDFAQLSPVKDDYCFTSQSWKKHVRHMINLTSSVRHQDPQFIKILDEVRFGNVSKETRELFATRVGIEFDGDIQPTTLYPYRKNVDEINANELKKLLNDKVIAYQFLSEDVVLEKNISRKATDTEVDMMNKVFPVGNIINLCVGAQVMLTSNIDEKHGLFNGSRGIIDAMEPCPVVRFDNVTMEIPKKTFESKVGNTSYMRTQIPLILAWALTIHRCQGVTLSKVVTDLSDVFCPSQAYVSLSRVRTLNGLYLMGIDYKKIFCDKRVVDLYKN